MSETKDFAHMWDEKPSKSRSHLVVLLALVALTAAGYAGARELLTLSPKWAWRRAIHSSEAKVRAEHWTRLQRETLIDGLDRPSTIREVFASLADADP